MLNRPQRQDTFDLRDQIHPSDHQAHQQLQPRHASQQHQQHMQGGQEMYTSDEDHSVLEDDSPTEDADGEYMDDDDRSSELSIPNESIDFDLVYSLHSFAATVEGQANVFKGDSLILMDDSNSYWWLVRVLKTQDVGYIPAENIETPFERLARLNKHRNVDLAQATQEEITAARSTTQRRVALSAPSPSSDPRSTSPSSGIPQPTTQPSSRSAKTRSVIFTETSHMFRYPPAAWDSASDTSSTEYVFEPGEIEELGYEEDDGMSWEDGAVEEAQAQISSGQSGAPSVMIPGNLRPGGSANSPAQIQSPNDIVMGSRREHVGEGEETRRITVTPPVAQTQQQDSPVTQPSSQQPLAPSAIIESAKRAREEAEAEDARKKARDASRQGAKLRKEPTPSTLSTSSNEDEKEKKDKKRGVFSGLFSRGKKEKQDKERSSEDSHTSSQVHDSPTTPLRQAQQPAQQQKQQQQQQQQQQRTTAPSQDPQTPQQQQPGVSQHVQRMAQKDQHHQQMYQQYLTRSPSSPESLTPSYGLQSASVLHTSWSSPPNSQTALNVNVAPQRQRPGSLVLSPTSAIPELSVIRVFAGRNMDAEATFKTVLLNSSTTGADLVRQAMQRFRIHESDVDPTEFFITIKQLDGSSVTLLPNETPLNVFESLVSRQADIPRVKRSSMGSISSVASNLSMHPAIKKLDMNDFTDDSAVKFYLNRREGDESFADDEESTIRGEQSFASLSEVDEGRHLRVDTSGNVPAERFNSPSLRFALQVAICPEDLPDDMIFDPQTEAIVFRHSLTNRSSTSSTSVSMAVRKKVMVFAKNVTVAEVIEQSLERFGVVEGVVDGGDEVEDKLGKRRSSGRVRYGLGVEVNGKERDLHPTSKVVDAFPTPPLFKPFGKRRSIDASSLLGNAEDVQPDDPVFFLRRATSYRTTSRRMSAPLDELALHKLQRESMSSSSAVSDSAPDGAGEERQMSQREIIAAQRAASRANQRAILSAQSNSVRGVDVVLPNKGVLRSSRYEDGEKMRYSYVQPDGETYDISDIIEEEWQGGGATSPRSAKSDDLLEGVVKSKGINDIDRVLTKIREKPHHPPVLRPVPQPSVSSSTIESGRSTSTSVYSTSTERTAPSPISLSGAYGPRSTSPVSESRNTTPVPGERSGSRAKGQQHKSQPSIASVMSDYSNRAGTPTGRGTPTGVQPSSSAAGSAPAPTLSSSTTPPSSSTPAAGSALAAAAAPQQPPSRAQSSMRRAPIILKDDFGVSSMLSIIELDAALSKPSRPPRRPVDPVDAMLFGEPLDLNELHPAIREIYGESFQALQEMDDALDRAMMELTKV